MKKFIFSILFILIFHIGCASLNPERDVVNNQFFSTYASEMIGVKFPRGYNRRDLFHDKIFTWVGNNDIVNFRLENAKLVGTFVFGKKLGYYGYKIKEFTLVAWFTDVEGVIIAKSSYTLEDREVYMGEKLKFAMDMPEGYKKFVYVVFSTNTYTFEEVAKSKANPYYNRGLAYLRKGQYDKGIIELNKATELSPLYASAYYDRGTAYGKKGHYDQAISDLTKAIELNPWHWFAYNNRGFAYKSKGQYDQAISDFTKAIELNPKHYNANINRGFAYESKGQYDHAISDYSKAIEINQKNPNAYNNIAWILATCVDARYRDGERAVELSQNAVKLSRTSNHLDTLAAAYAEAGKFEDAIATQEKVIDLMQKEGKPKNQIDQCKKHLKSYKTHKPWRESRPDTLKDKK